MTKPKDKPPVRIEYDKPHIPERTSGPHYLVTTKDSSVWWRDTDRQPVYVTPAHWWDI